MLTGARIRRVKCDETKPSCRRCLSYWGYCEGYANPHGKSAAPPMAPAPLLRLRNDRVVSVQQILRQSLMGPAFETLEENDYFKIFLNSTSCTLAGAFETPVWGYLLPQHAARQPFIRYGVAAIGAMTATFTEVMAMRFAGHIIDDDNCLRFSNIYQKAIALYAKFLQHMRIALSKPNHSIRDALLGCLLVVCFEGFIGHYYNSAMHAQNGLEFFYTWLSHERATRPQISQHSSPNSTEVEDDIVAAMHRLDLQVLYFFDSRAARTHNTLATQDAHILRSIPSAFRSLPQARHFWDLICRRICHFLAASMSSTGSVSTALMLPGPTVPYPETLDAPIGIKLFAQSGNALTGHDAERAGYMADIEAWDRASAPLVKQLLVAGGIQARGATILLIHAKMIRILLAGAFFESEMEYDSLLPEFQSIYDLASSIWHSHVVPFDSGISFDFEAGVLPPLFLVVTRSRDPNLRRQIVNLLSTSFHRESYWDSCSMAYIARWIISMEERGCAPPAERLRMSSLGGGQPAIRFPEVPSGPGNVAAARAVPEVRRIRIARFNIELNMRKVQLEFTRGRASEGEEPVFEQDAVRW
jgi:hypothetical protein